MITVAEWVTLDELGPLGCGPSSTTYGEQYLELASFAIKCIWMHNYNCRCTFKKLGKTQILNSTSILGALLGLLLV